MEDEKVHCDLLKEECPNFSIILRYRKYKINYKKFFITNLKAHKGKIQENIKL